MLHLPEMLSKVEADETENKCLLEMEGVEKEIVANNEDSIDNCDLEARSECGEEKKGVTEVVEQEQKKPRREEMATKRDDEKLESAEFLEECQFEEGEEEGVQVVNEKVSVHHGRLVRRNSLDRLGGLHMVHKVELLQHRIYEYVIICTTFQGVSCSSKKSFR